jgi:hypothetical protein
LIRTIQQAFAHLVQARVPAGDSLYLLALSHQGPKLIADERLRHQAEVYAFLISFQEERR